MKRIIAHIILVLILLAIIVGPAILMGENWWVWPSVLLSAVILMFMLHWAIENM